MAALNIDTSRAKQVSMSIFRYNDVPLVMRYIDKTDPGNPVPINILPYRFDFYLHKQDEESIQLKTYTLLENAASTAFLVKEDTNVLNMQLMLQDIRDFVVADKIYHLVQFVKDTEGRKYVHVVYTINAGQY